MIDANETKEGRAAERRQTIAPSTMRTDCGAPVDVVVLDISSSGVRILTSAQLEIGQEISIGLSGAGVTRAFVAWRIDDQYGCAFERPIPAEDTAIAFSKAPVAILGRASVVAAEEKAGTGDDDYLRELYRQHRPWAVPWDAVAMGIALIGAVVAFVRL